MRLEIIKGLSENRGKLQFGRMFERTGEPRNKKHTLQKSNEGKSFFIVNKLFAKLKQKKAKREVQAIKSTR